MEAGAKCTFVCCEGEEELLSNRYEHRHAFCSLCKSEKHIVGPLHFTIDQDKKFTYFCQACVQSEANKELIPKACISIKAQVEDMEAKQWPDLASINEKLV